MAATAAHAGPIREVFAAPWVVVVPDDPTPHGRNCGESLGKLGEERMLWLISCYRPLFSHIFDGIHA